MSFPQCIDTPGDLLAKPDHRSDGGFINIRHTFILDRISFAVSIVEHAPVTRDKAESMRENLKRNRLSSCFETIFASDQQDSVATQHVLEKRVGRCALPAKLL